MRIFAIFNNHKDIQYCWRVIFSAFSTYLARRIIYMANVSQSSSPPLPWPGFYPVNANVPPKDAVDTKGYFFRLVKKKPPEAACFLTTHEEQPTRHLSQRLSTEDKVNIYGASFYDDRNGAADLREKFPKALGDRLIAGGEFYSYMGKMKKTRGPSHFTVWLKVGCDIHQHFKCVEG